MRESRQIHSFACVPRRAAALLWFGLFCCSGAAICQEQSALSLHSAIDQAEASPQAQAAQDQVGVANGSVTQAGLRPNPRLYLQSEDLRPWDSNFSYLDQTEEYGYLSQTFELGGKRSRRLEFARANLSRVEADRTLTVQQIAARVAAAYWTAVMTAGVASLLEEDMKAVDEMVRYSRERVAAGAMRGVDLLRVQIERDRLLLSLEAARRDVSLTRIELFRQMGRKPDKQVKLSDSLESTQPVKAETLALALAARPDVAAARGAVASAEADVHLQKSLAVPDLDLLGGYKRNFGANTLYSALQITLPFSNRNQGEVARARASVRLAKDRLQQLELSVAADVSAAEEAYHRQRDIVQTILPDIRSRAKQDLAIMEDAYRSGGVDLLRYLDAERTAVDVDISALRTLADFQQSVVRLQLAYGVRP